MRRVYSQSSDQMKNSAIGRPNCRTASVRRNSETKLAITAGTSAASKPSISRYIVLRCRFIGWSVPSGASALLDSQPQPSPWAASAASRAASASGSGSVSSSMIQTASHPSSAAARMP